MFITEVRRAALRTAAAATCIATMLAAGGVNAANNSTFSQTINPGTLATDIKNASRVTVASPAVTMSAKTLDFDCQVGGSASTGTFGTNSERIYVVNPDAADNGWTLALAATSGATSSWAGAAANMDFNDPTVAVSAGCGDGADTDSYKGQLTVDPSVGTLTADSIANSTASITKGSSAAFSEGVTDSVTLLTAAAGSVDIGRWYLTGVSMSQTIPAEQPADAYTINLTLTVTAS